MLHDTGIEFFGDPHDAGFAPAEPVLLQRAQRIRQWTQGVVKNDARRFRAHASLATFIAAGIVGAAACTSASCAGGGRPATKANPSERPASHSRRYFSR